MAICPAGHTSTAEDYCDVCGLPVSSGAGSAPPVATTDAAPAGAICPNCGTVNAPDALFCEACGYDFTTGTMPRSAVLPAAWGASESAVVPDPPRPQAWPTAEFPGLASDDESAPAAHAGPGQPAPVIPGGAGISTADDPQPPRDDQPGSGSEQAVPVTSTDAGTSTAGDSQPPHNDRSDSAPGHSHPVVPADAGVSTGSEAARTDRPASFAGVSGDVTAGGGAAAVGGPGEPGPTPPSRRPLQSRPTSVEWVAEVWIDPDWYATQGSTDQLPSPGLPDVVPLRANSALIGRTSRSRNIHPDIDCELDSGVSRRHAQVTSDGTRWWIEDLESANGTFVGPSAGPLPVDPIGRGRIEFAPDQRIYLGAWTRIVIRAATDDEKQAFNA